MHLRQTLYRLSCILGDWVDFSGPLGLLLLEVASYFVAQNELKLKTVMLSQSVLPRLAVPPLFWTIVPFSAILVLFLYWLTLHIAQAFFSLQSLAPQSPSFLPLFFPVMPPLPSSPLLFHPPPASSLFLSSLSYCVTQPGLRLLSAEAALRYSRVWTLESTLLSHNAGDGTQHLAHAKQLYHWATPPSFHSACMAWLARGNSTLGTISQTPVQNLVLQFTGHMTKGKSHPLNLVSSLLMDISHITHGW